MSQFFVNTSSGGGGGGGTTQFTTDSGIATPVAGNINILGGAGASTTGAVDTITINVINDGFPWSDQAISFAAAVQNGYFCTAALTVTLPSAGLVTGSTVIIYVDTSAAVVLQAAAGQSIEISQTSSTVAGTATSTAQGNIVTLVFRTSDLTWHAISSAGSFTMA